jgi:hypothetical protein
MPTLSKNACAGPGSATPAIASPASAAGAPSTTVAAAPAIRRRVRRPERTCRELNGFLGSAAGARAAAVIKARCLFSTSLAGARR